MTGDVAFRPMLPSDSPAVGELLRAVLPHAARPYMVYCQPGVDHYLHEIAARPEFFPGYVDQVAVVGGTVVGFAEVRATGHLHTLTYFAVSATLQRRGVGRGLLASAVTRSKAATTVELDVFDLNPVARAFYESLGASEIRRSTWWIALADSPNRNSSSSLRVVDWHLSAASLHRYGFCNVQIEICGRTELIGMPSASVGRLYNLPGDMDRLQAFASAFKLTHWLYISDESDPPLAGWQPLLTSHRLSLPVVHLIGSRR